MIAYLSPTTFIRYLNCPHQVKLLKIDKVLGEAGKGREDQTMAMAVGTAFDAMCKAKLNRRYKLEEILKTEVLEKNKGAVLLAAEIFKHYSNGALQALQNEGVGYGGVDQETELHWIDSQTGVEWVSVCRGMPDMVLTKGNIIDWKVNGAFSSRGALPREGWTRCFLNGKNLGEHFRSSVSLHEVDRNWAIQTYLYARILGHRCGEDMFAGIEQVAVSEKNEVYCASFRNKVDKDFQVWCEREFHKAFKALNRNETERPHYHAKRCVQYNQLCQVAQHCEAYREQQARVLSQPIQSPGTGCPAGTVQVGGEGFGFLVTDEGIPRVQPDHPVPPCGGGDGPSR